MWTRLERSISFQWGATNLGHVVQVFQITLLKGLYSADRQFSVSSILKAFPMCLYLGGSRAIHFTVCIQQMWRCSLDPSENYKICDSGCALERQRQQMLWASKISMIGFTSEVMENLLCHTSLQNKTRHLSAGADVEACDKRGSGLYHPNLQQQECQLVLFWKTKNCQLKWYNTDRQ